MNHFAQNRFILLLLLILLWLPLPAQTLDLVQTNGVNNIERYGEDIAARLIKADNLMRRGEFEQAIIQYDQAAAQNPMLADVYMRRAIAKFRIGRSREAQIDYQRATLLNPYIADLYGYGNAQRALQVMALTPEQHLLRFDHDILRHFLEREYKLENGEQRQDRGISPQAWSEFTGERTPTEPGQMQSASDWDAALLASRAIYDERTASATALLQQAQQVPRALRVFIQAMLAIQQDNWTQAEELIAPWLDDRRPYSPLLFLQAELLQHDGNYEQAVTIYDRIIEQEGELLYALALMNRAVLHKLNGNQLQALSDLEAAERQPLPTAWKPLLNKLRGNTYLLLGDYHSARAAYNRAIQQRPDFAEAYHNRALVHILSYNWPDACADFEKSIELGHEKSREKQRYFCGF
mgnify:CR=1 FL=1